MNKMNMVSSPIHIKTQKNKITTKITQKQSKKEKTSRGKESNNP
jgi:hypothetical protein